MSLKRLLFFSASVAVVVAAASCREPSQVVIEARTNVVHQPGYVTTFTVGPHASLEDAPPTTETREPWGADGFIGSLVAVPGSGSNDAALTVKLVLGVRRDVRECEPPLYAGCIVARRKLRYAPNERLRLPISLYAQCENVPCDAETTCNYLGQCVAATVDPTSCASDEGCTVSGDRPTTIPRPGEEAGVPNDATPGEDASADATTADAPSDSASDARSDGPSEGGSSFFDAGAPGSIWCPPNYCLAGQKCCVGAASPFCAPKSAQCAAPTGVAECDGREDCGPGETCCVQNTGIAICGLTSCNGGAGYYELCHSSADCSAGRACSSAALWVLTYPTCQ